MAQTETRKEEEDNHLTYLLCSFFARSVYKMKYPYVYWNSKVHRKDWQFLSILSHLNSDNIFTRYFFKVHLISSDFTYVGVKKYKFQEFRQHKTVFEIFSDITFVDYFPKYIIYMIIQFTLELEAQVIFAKLKIM